MAKVLNIGGNTISYGGFLLRELGNGSLTISKSVSGSGFDPSKTFELTVVFSAPVTYNGTTATTHTFNLAHGQSVTITGIPELTEYEVTETPLSQQDIDAGYTISGMTGGSGKIANNGEHTAAATNEYRNKAILTVSKSLTGDGYDPTKTFEIVVTFDSAISYTVNGVEISTPSSTYTGNFTGGQSVVLGNIPNGTAYTVTETPISAADAALGYRLLGIDGASGTALWNGEYTASVRNYFHAPGGKIRFKFENTSYDPTAGNYGEQWKSGAQWTNLGNGVWEYSRADSDWIDEFRAESHPNRWGSYTGKFSIISADLGGVTDGSYMFLHAKLTSTVLFDISHIGDVAQMFEDTLLTNAPAFDARQCEVIDFMFSGSKLTTASLLALWDLNKRRDDPTTMPTGVFKYVNSTYLNQIPYAFGGSLERSTIYESSAPVGTEFTIKCNDFLQCKWSSGGSAGSHTTTFTRISGDPMFGESGDTITISNGDLSQYGSRTANWRWAKSGVYRLTSGSPQTVTHKRYPIDLGV